MRDSGLQIHLKTGGGPAGLALSNDERFLYTVNSFSSDISVIDLTSGQEQKRLTAGNNPTGISINAGGSGLLCNQPAYIVGSIRRNIKMQLTIINDRNQRIAGRIDVDRHI